MEKKAISKFVRISAFKAREVTRLIQGKPVPEALAFLDLCPRKAATPVAKTLRSAVANMADNGSGASADELFVKEAVVGEGSTMKRIRPKARGMSGRIRKRTSHIYVTVTDETLKTSKKK
jgi:large subunit ribosomal protein L22